MMLFSDVPKSSSKGDLDLLVRRGCRVEHVRPTVRARRRCRRRRTLRASLAVSGWAAPRRRSGVRGADHLGLRRFRTGENDFCAVRPTPGSSAVGVHLPWSMRRSRLGRRDAYLADCTNDGRERARLPAARWGRWERDSAPRMTDDVWKPRTRQEQQATRGTVNDNARSDCAPLCDSRRAANLTHRVP